MEIKNKNNNMKDPNPTASSAVPSYKAGVLQTPSQSAETLKVSRKRDPVKAGGKDNVSPSSRSRCYRGSLPDLYKAQRGLGFFPFPFKGLSWPVTPRGLGIHHSGWSKTGLVSGISSSDSGLFDGPW